MADLLGWPAALAYVLLAFLSLRQFAWMMVQANRRDFGRSFYAGWMDVAVVIILAAIWPIGHVVIRIITYPIDDLPDIPKWVRRALLGKADRR